MHNLALPLLAVSLVDDLSSNPFLPEFVGIFVASLLWMVSVKFKIPEQLALLFGSLVLIGAIALRVVMLRGQFTVGGLISILLPSVAVFAWILSVYQFRRKVAQAISGQYESIVSIHARLDELTGKLIGHSVLVGELSEKISRMPEMMSQKLAAFESQFANIFKTVRLPVDYKTGPPAPYELTPMEIKHELRRAPPLVAEAHARTYLGSFVRWRGELMHIAHRNGILDLLLATTCEDETGPSVSLSVPEQENPVLKRITYEDEVIVAGYIAEITIYPVMSIRLINAVVSVADRNSKAS